MSPSSDRPQMPTVARSLSTAMARYKKPNEHYVREMKRFGILPASFDLAADTIDVYAADQRYWESMWHNSIAPLEPM